MNEHARVVGIGGGLVGSSSLYHLTRLGWDDVMLLEIAALDRRLPSVADRDGEYHLVKAETLDAEHDAFDVAVLGVPHRTRLLDAPPFDPAGRRLRG